MMYTCVYRCQCLQLQEQAKIHWCQSLVKHSFSQWRVQLLERKALKFDKVLLLSRYFHLWNSHRNLIQYSTLSAESFYTEVSNILSSECYIRVFAVESFTMSDLSLFAWVVFRDFSRGQRGHSVPPENSSWPLAIFRPISTFG